MPSGRQLAQIYAQRFEDWIAERTERRDWLDYSVKGSLNREEIAREIGCSRSVIGSNKAIKTRLEALEADLREQEILGQPRNPQNRPQEAADAPQGPDPRDTRIKQLEERLATSLAECASLRQRVRQLEAVQDEMVPTGRRIDPGPGFLQN